MDYGFFSSGVSAHSNYSCSQERFNAINAHFSEYRDSVLTEIEVGLDHRIGLGEDGQLWLCPEGYTLKNITNLKCASDGKLLERTWSKPTPLKIGTNFDKALYLKRCKSMIFLSFSL